MYAFQRKRNLDGPLKNKELWSYVVKFEFSRPKSSSVLEVSEKDAFKDFSLLRRDYTTILTPRQGVNETWLCGRASAHGVMRGRIDSSW